MLMDPDQEKFGPPLPMSDLVSEAAVLLSAGNTAPSLTLTLGTFYILNNRHVLETLQDELCHVIPDKRRLPPLDTLRRLPYLVRVYLPASCISWYLDYNSRPASSKNPCGFLSAHQANCRASHPTKGRFSADAGSHQRSDLRKFSFHVSLRS